MKKYRFTPRGVCSRAIEIEIENGVVHSVRFEGGCSGNTQGVAALVRGMRAEEAIERLSGIRCGFRPTSCPDQLSIALREALACEAE
ncbi:MAG: TIGR03905 family TSCPD domain-containing protein [Clostridia bacterium]|nr:TIGR03905 family TSCPD domain-containing protein [Clostridia bacterium]